MTTLSSTLQIAKSALTTQQAALNVTAHNIANASTEGYTRQRALLEAGTPVHFPNGVFGTGVQIDDVQRLGDMLLDAAYYRESTGSSGYETRAGMLERVEEVFGEPSDLGLAAALDAFHSAWSALATNPGSSTLRSGVRLTADTLVNTFRRISQGLQMLREETETRLDSELGEVSRLTAEIADINRQITIAESSGETAGDLRDERARRLGTLSELLPIQVTERNDGSVGVATGGISIVDGVVSQALESRVSGTGIAVAVVGRAGTLQLSGASGSIGALVGILNNDLPAIQASLDDLASALVSDVNAIHVGGTNPTGTTGVNFFDPAGVRGSTISLSAAVMSSVDLIASGTPDGLGGYRAGANDVALGLAALRDVDSAALGNSFLDHFRGLVFDLGHAVRSSRDAAQVHAALSHQAGVRRDELGGVSIDEELVKMVEFQTAYQAAARVVTTVDEMLQTLVTV